jgi:hypothetical protein
MIDLLLKAIDRIIDLAKIKEKHVRARYEEIYKPSFDELQSVHTDYLTVFSELESKLRVLESKNHCNIKSEEINEILKFIGAHRTTFLPIRQKLWVLRELFEGAAGQNLPTDEQEFIWSIVIYFLRDEMNLFDVAYSQYSTQYAWIKALLAGHLQSKDVDSIKAVREECQKVIVILQSSWEESVKLFNELRLKYTQNSA